MYFGRRVRRVSIIEFDAVLAQSVSTKNYIPLFSVTSRWNHNTRTFVYSITNDFHNTVVLCFSHIFSIRTFIVGAASCCVHVTRYVYHTPTWHVLIIIRLDTTQTDICLQFLYKHCRKVRDIDEFALYCQSVRFDNHKPKRSGRRRWYFE